MNVKIVKLVTGEEILSNVDEYDNNYVLKNPMMLVMHQEGLQMVPWLMLAKQPEATVDKDKIVLSYEARDELVTAYQQQTGGIVTVSANAIDTKGKLVV